MLLWWPCGSASEVVLRTRLGEKNVFLRRGVEISPILSDMWEFTISVLWLEIKVSTGVDLFVCLFHFVLFCFSMPTAHLVMRSIFESEQGDERSGGHICKYHSCHGKFIHTFTLAYNPLLRFNF